MAQGVPAVVCDWIKLPDAICLRFHLRPAQSAIVYFWGQVMHAYGRFGVADCDAMLKINAEACGQMTFVLTLIGSKKFQTIQTLIWLAVASMH